MYFHFEERSRTLKLFQVPGRLGLLVTLYLITSNIYSAVQAPASRGFSYIEVWMIGIEATILLAILEYGMVLCCRKFLKKCDLNCVDIWTFFAAFLFFVIFNVYFCQTAYLSLVE